MFIKKSIMAAALAALSVPAFAAIGNAGTGNGELFLAVSNPFAEEPQRVTYVLDLGIAMNDFLPGSAAASSSFTRSMTGFSSFLSTLSTQGGSPTDLRFAVLALDSVGDTSTPGSIRMLTTTGLTALDMTSPAPQTEAFQNQDVAAIVSASSSVTRFVTATNLLATHNSAADGSSTRVRSGSVDNADFSNAFLDSLGFQGSQLNFTAGTAVGELARFVLASNAAGAGNAAANVINYSLNGANVDDIASNLVSTFGVVIDGDNASLVYTAAIPEPGEWAFMLAGLSLAGMIARRRRSRA